MLTSLTMRSVEQRYPADQPDSSVSDALEAIVFAGKALAKIAERFNS